MGGSEPGSSLDRMWRRVAQVWRSASGQTLLAIGATLCVIGVVAGWVLLVVMPHPPIGLLVGLGIFGVGTTLVTESRVRRRR